MLPIPPMSTPDHVRAWWSSYGCGCGGDYQVRYGHVSYDAPSVVGVHFKQSPTPPPSLELARFRSSWEYHIDSQSLAVLQSLLYPQFAHHGGNAHWYTPFPQATVSQLQAKLTTPQSSMEEPVSSRSAMPPRYVAHLNYMLLSNSYSPQNFPEHQFPSIVGRPILRTEEQGSDVVVKDIMCGDEAAAARSMLQISYPVRLAGASSPSPFYPALSANPACCVNA